MLGKFNNKTDGLITYLDLKKAHIKIVYALMFFILFICMLACLIPVVWVFLSGFKTPAEMYRIPPTFLPERVDLSKIPEILGKVAFGGYLFNTIKIIIGCWFFDIFFNGLAGYVLSKVRPLGSAFLETVIFMSMLLPGISMVPLYMTFCDLPLIHLDISESYLPLFMMAGCSAFNVMLFRNFFNGIPSEYMEAAQIDGCKNLEIFTKIILPLSKPIIAVVTIFSVLASWGNFMWPFILFGDSDKAPISVLLYNISRGDLSLQQNDIMLLTMLAIIPPVVIYCFLSKHITGGLNMSGIKG